MPASRTTSRTPGVAGAVLAAVAVVALIAVGTALVVLTGTTSSEDKGGTDAGFALDPISDDPTAVATVVMAGIYTWQPSVQDSTWDALHAQRAFLTGPIATAAATPPDPAPRPIGEWAGWARSDDTVTAAVEASGEAVVDDDTAAVFLEPIMGEGGVVVPPAGYLAEARAAATEAGALLVFDEMITGYRWSASGAQALYGVTPDLSCWGKAMGNGFPISALAGRREFMELGGLNTDAERVFLLSTTHGPESVSLTAFRAVARAYREGDPVGAMERAGHA